ncbi:MAG: hypothetical protein E6Q55_19130 [Mycolicibacterium mageritense]|nr:MAG: hypothetical protein E6Q55_19130 [Mycolicibacterium mageritense]
MALIAVIAVSVVGTVLVLRPESNGNAGGGDNGGGNPPTSATSQNGKSEFASANDTGPVNIIAEDPTCDSWRAINNRLAEQEQAVSWSDRDKSSSASGWNPDERNVFESVGRALATAADDSVKLSKATPHRVVRELYDQFIAYARAFAQSVPAYEPADNATGETAHTVASTLTSLCSAVQNRSAATVALLVTEAKPPSTLGDPGDPGDPQTMFAAPISICDRWNLEATNFNASIADWQSVSSNIPASEWTPEQRAIYDAVAPVMIAYANKVEELGRQSGNAIVEDIAVLSAQYRRAYVKALPGYTVADNDLSNTASYSAAIINVACKVVS